MDGPGAVDHQRIALALVFAAQIENKSEEKHDECVENDLR